RNSSVQKHLRPLKIKPEPHFLQPRLGHGLAQSLAVLGVEEQESATARPYQFSADGAAAASELVPLVDLRIAHLLGAVLLVLPILVQQLAEQRAVAGFQRALAANAEVFDIVQVRQHLLVELLRAILLLLEDRSGAAREAGEEQQQVVFEIPQRVHAD